MHERREARRQREACGCGPGEGEGRQEGCEWLWDGAHRCDALPPPAVLTAARRLVVFPQDAYPDHAGPHDYPRAVLNAESPLLDRRRARSRRPGSRLALSCVAAVPALGLITVAVGFRLQVVHCSP